jgi:predicted house-cleaning noncanonical NTP pyrophosphatase (MazG superfamily)
MSEKDKERIEEFANEFMSEEGLKGKARQMKIMRIIEAVGFDKKKIKTALLRSTIKNRIKEE